MGALATWLAAVWLTPGCPTGNASATVPDLFGTGSRWQGAGGGGVAVVDDGTAAYTNPAGLADVRRPTAAIGYVQGWPRFHDVGPLWWDTNRDGLVTADDPPLDWSANPPSMGGIHLLAGRNVGGKFGLGVFAYVPTRNLIRFAMVEPSLPTYVLYANRPQRFVAAAAIGGHLFPGVSIGVGADLLAKAKVRVAATLSATIEPPASTTPEGATTDDLGAYVSDVTVDMHEVELSLVPAVAPIAGLRVDLGELVDALEGVRIGASYHGKVGLPLTADVDVQANAEVTGFGDLEPFVTAAVARATLSMFDHYVPQRLTTGVGYARPDLVMAYVDVVWTDWRGLVLNVARLDDGHISSPFVAVDDAVIHDGNPYTVSVRSTWSVKGGAEVTLPKIPISGRIGYVRFRVRAGGGTEPSPLVSQGASSAFLDSRRSFAAIGFGVEHWDPFALIDGAVRYDLVAQWHWLAEAQLPRTAEVPAPGYVVGGGSIPVGGAIPVIGGQWSFDY